MSETKNVTKALLQVQAAVEPVKANAEGHHGKFANLESVMSVLKPLLENANLAIFQSPSSGTAGSCTIITTLIHTESGEQLESTITIPMQRQNDPQAYGAAMTYGRRYSLMCMFGMVTEDDDAKSASYTLERLLREMSNALDVNELGKIRDQHFTKGLLKDSFWNRVYSVVYDLKYKSFFNQTKE